MKTEGLTRILSIIIILLISQTAISQNIFILEKPGRMKIFKYRVNDGIKLRMANSGEIVSGKIMKISDSSIFLNQRTEVLLKDIEAVIRKQWGFNLLRTDFLSSGILYFSISSLNGILNNDRPVVPEETLFISGSLIAAGVILSPFSSRICKVDNKKWRIKSLDFTGFTPGN